VAEPMSAVFHECTAETSQFVEDGRPPRQQGARVADLSIGVRS
jgi:hypothetical protein